MARKTLLLLIAVVFLLQVEALYSGKPKDVKKDQPFKYLGDRTLYSHGVIPVYDIPINVPDLAAEICDNAQLYCPQTYDYTVDGSCNPPSRPYTWAAGQKFKRIFGGMYDVGPVFHSRTINSMPFHSHGTMPNVRHLSTLIRESELSSSSVLASGLFPAFTQVVLNDISLSPNGGKHISCCGYDIINYNECAAFSVPQSNKGDDNICAQNECTYRLENVDELTCRIYLDGVEMEEKQGTVKCFNDVAIHCQRPMDMIIAEKSANGLDESDDDFEDVEDYEEDAENEASAEDVEDTNYSSDWASLLDEISDSEGVNPLDLEDGTIAARSVGHEDEEGFRFYVDEKAVHLHENGWRCKSQLPPQDWFKPSFDDGHWIRAERIGDTDLLWAPLDAEQDVPEVYCRYSMNKEYKSVILTGTGELRAWVDGIEVSELPNRDRQAVADTFFYQPQSSLIAVRVAVTSGETAALLLDSNTELKSSTDDRSWKCLLSNLPNGPAGWETIHFDDNSWRIPQGAEVEPAAVSGISHTDWVTGQGTNPYLYCRISLHAPEVCIDYKRNLPFCGDPGTARKTLREQVNVVTGALDMSFLYGTTKASSDLLRDKHGRMKVGSKRRCLDDLPKTELEPKDFLRMSGDNHHSTSPHVQAMYALFLNEHNKIAEKIRKVYDLNSDTIWKIARRINIAQYQSIVYNELLPMLIGDANTRKFFSDDGTTFSKTGDAGVYHSAVLGLKAVIASSTLDHICEGNDEHKGYCRESVTLAEFYEDRSSLSRELNLCHEDLFSYMGSQVTNFRRGSVVHDLYCKFNGKKDDQLARIIQEGRDTGMVGYHQIRNFCGLERLGEEKLAELGALPWRYDDYEDIDFIVGAMVEDADKSDQSVGETLSCIFGFQFKLLAQGDQHFFNHVKADKDFKKFEPFFTEEQRAELNARTLADILCDNLDDEMSPLIPKNALLMLSDHAKNCGRYHVNSLDIESFVDRWLTKRKKHWQKKV